MKSSWLFFKEIPMIQLRCWRSYKHCKLDSSDRLRMMNETAAPKLGGGQFNRIRCVIELGISLLYRRQLID